MLSRWYEEQEEAAMEYRRRAELLEAERQYMYNCNNKKEMENVKTEDNSLEDFKELNKNKKGKTMFNMNFSNMFNGMFGKVGEGLAALGMNGQIAIKTSKGFKTYNVKTKRLINVDSFCMEANNMFFIMPTSKVKVGDIIMHNDVPKCVVEVLPDTIKVIDYGTSTIEEIAPDRHIAMGAGYMYGKIVNPFISSIGGKGAMKKMLGFATMNELMGNKSSGGMFSDGMFGQMMQMQMMMMNMFGGKKDGEDCFNFFDSLFDIDFDFDSDKEDK